MRRGRLEAMKIHIDKVEIDGELAAPAVAKIHGFLVMQVSLRHDVVVHVTPSQDADVMLRMQMSDSQEAFPARRMPAGISTPYRLEPRKLPFKGQLWVGAAPASEEED